MRFFFALLASFFSEFEGIEVSEDSDLIIAGVDRLKRFGFLATVIELSRRDHIKREDVLESPAREILNVLYYDMQKGEVEKDYIRIKSAKNG